MRNSHCNWNLLENISNESIDGKVLNAQPIFLPKKKKKMSAQNPRICQFQVDLPA